MCRTSLIVGIILFGLCLSRQVWAFTVAPAIMEISGHRGETVETFFTLANTSDSEEIYYFDKLKFKAKDETGSPLFLPYSEDHSGLTEWLSFPNQTATIPKNSFAEIPFIINIPSNVLSGSFYTAITISDNQTIKNSSAQTKTAILIFLNIKGENKERAALLDFIPSSVFTTKTNNVLTFRIQNQGNVYLEPQGTITFKNIFGQTVNVININPKEEKILTGSTRKFEINFDSGWTIGPITAELNLIYGDKHQELNSSVILWIVPIKIIGIILLGLLILILGLIIIRNQRIKFSARGSR